MTNKEKAALAGKLIEAAGTLIEFWLEDGVVTESDCTLAHLTHDEIREQLASWLKNLPGDHWDMRLGQCPK